jgi:GTP-binding protein
MNNEAFYKSATFLLSAAKVLQLPADTGYEVAFAGRSNSGKSSVINKLTTQHNLARASKTPGRTQLINVFTLDEQRRFIDLPGYGYAKVPEEIKSAWQKSLNIYFNKRESLCGIILIMDIRHPLKEHDMVMLEWAYSAGLPVHILLNKADKLSKGAANNVMLEVQKELEPFSNLISVQTFSALKKQGLDRCYEVINGWLKRDDQIAAPE